MPVTEMIYARLGTGSKTGWLLLLSQGWSLPDLIIEPMAAHHGQYSVLMTRKVQ